MAKIERFIPNPEKPASNGQELGAKIFRFVFEKNADSVRNRAFSDLVNLEEAKIKDRETQLNLTNIKNYIHTDYFSIKKEEVKNESSRHFVKKLTLNQKIGEKCAKDPEYRSEYEACRKLVEPFLNDRTWLTKDTRGSRILREETELITKSASIAYLKGIIR